MMSPIGRGPSATAQAAPLPQAEDSLPTVAPITERNDAIVDLMKTASNAKLPVAQAVIMALLRPDSSSSSRMAEESTPQP